MNFLQKNKSVIVIGLMAGFLLIIVTIFISGISGPDTNPLPTGDSPLQTLGLVTSTSDVTPLAPPSGQNTKLGTPVTVSPTPTELTSQDTGSPSSPVTEVSVTETPPGTYAPPPPAVDFVVTDDGPPGTDFPPPAVIEDLPTETPPPGNGLPPGS